VIRVGTAGWALPKASVAEFPPEGSHLARYAKVFTGVEINSSFHRPHRRTTYERWAASVPDAFKFVVKVPKAITHTSRLAGSEPALDAFAEQVGGLGRKLGPLLVQLPPSLIFDAEIAGAFFTALRARFPGAAVCEPRHASWLSDEADGLLRNFLVARVAAHPAIGMSKSETGGEPQAGGWDGLFYMRLHGAPRPYYSDYGDDALVDFARRLTQAAATAVECWCMFDNTTLGFATANALALQRLTAAASGGR
jgi:uncharacterized protein YecE (DUF72 family)